MDEITGVSRRTFLGGAVAAGMLAALQPGVAGAVEKGRRRVGYVMSSEQFTIDQLVRYAAAADKAGFPIAWTSDHFQPWQPNEGHSCFAWATLAAATQKTSGLTLGTGVTCPTYRYNPAVVAEGFASLGLLAPGRVFLGVGTGEALNEAASGGGWGKYAERHDRLVEAVTLIRELWSGKESSYKGRYYQLDKARLYDVPAQPVPIWIAGNGPKSARLAGAHGDGWITTLEVLQDPKSRKAFEEGARSQGKDPASMEIVLETFAVAGDEAEAREGAEKWRFLKKAWKHGYVDNPDEADIQRRAEAEIKIEEITKDWLVGKDAAVHTRGLEKLFAAGATTVFVHSPQTDQMAFIDWYGRQVLPNFRS